MTPFIAEIVGTYILMLLGTGVNANTSLKETYGNSSGWIVTCFGWGMAVFCGVSVAGQFSGAHLNPAVTIGLAVAGEFPWSDVGSFIAAQFIGAILGSGMAWLAHKKHYDLETDQETILGTFSTGPAIAHTPLNIVSEIIGTFVLVFVVLYFSSIGLTDADGNVTQPVGLGSVGAIPVAFVVVAIGLSLGGTTGYAINPARDLGPRILHAVLPIPNKGGSNWGYSWIPVVGPILGATAAAGLYVFLGA